MEDIGAKLYELIKSEFDRLTARDVQLIGLTERIKREKATTKDLSEYSCRLGTHLRTAIEHNVSADALPNGQMYYNIAEKILSPLLHDNYDDINDIAVNIQEQLDKAQGIHIKPQKADFPEDRLHTVLNAASEPELDEATIIRRMSSPAENMTAGFADDYIEANAKFRSKAGFDTYIIRDDHSGCCPWCAKQAGKYRYPDEVPKEVFGRHDNCKCTVEYITGGTRQFVWSKRSWSSEKELEYLRANDRYKRAEQKIKEDLKSYKRGEISKPDFSKRLEERRNAMTKRKELLNKQPVRLSPSEAEAKEQFIARNKSKKLASQLTGGAESGIIKENIIVGRSLGAASKNYPITLPDGNHGKVLEGSEITDIVVFAGKGTDNPIRVAAKLEKTYHIPAEKWQKVRGTAFIRAGNTNKKAELHWYEAEGERVEMKVKKYYEDDES